MRSTELYSCKHCGQTFHTKEGAEACEMRHLYPKAVVSLTYPESTSLSEITFPSRIHVRLSDGRIGVYSPIGLLQHHDRDC